LYPKDSKKVKIANIIGARPQFIKAAPVGRAICEYNLGINSTSHGAMTGRMLEKIEEILIKEKPDSVLVYGDTNSTLAGALAAAKLHIPVAHVEAGLRSYNRQMPEEINRVLTDHISTVLFRPTQTAVNNLYMEGIGKNGSSFPQPNISNLKRKTEPCVALVGDVMYDSVEHDFSLQLYGDGNAGKKIVSILVNLKLKL